jgi:hypothetical protein
MNHLAYFALEMTSLREWETERQIALRRKRIADDDAPTRLRDRAWAAYMHRWASAARATTAAGDATRTELARTQAAQVQEARAEEAPRAAIVTPPTAAARSAGAGAATLGCASA